MSLVHYWYIDKKGIDSLLAQISSELIQEEHIKTIRKGIGKVAGNVGLAKILQQFFNADVTLSGGVETIYNFINIKKIRTIIVIIIIKLFMPITFI